MPGLHAPGTPPPCASGGHNLFRDAKTCEDATWRLEIETGHSLRAGGCVHVVGHTDLCGATPFATGRPTARS